MLNVAVGGGGLLGAILTPLLLLESLWNFCFNNIVRTAWVGQH